ncbi:MAG: site-2 protease family protein [Oscillospiraceae bacterium]|nr:site-2 protease family protein [Oscillospiraceae bacterium]
MLTNGLLTIFSVLFFLFVIVIHECGHFFTAKLFKIRVNEFAIGMGFKLLSFKRGETLYSLRLFPVGGYCAIEGEDSDSDDEGSFKKKSVWARMVVIVSGALSNILLGFVLTFIIFVQRPYFASTTIDRFSADAVSSQQLHANDRIKNFNGYEIHSERDLNFAMAVSEKPEVDVAVIRDGKEVKLQKVKFNSEKVGENKQQIIVDFSVKKIEKNFLTATTESFKETVSTVRVVWSSLVGLITGRFSFREMSGPIGIVSGVSKAASAGLKVSIGKALTNVTLTMMMISVNLGVVNLLPLPALDGGRFVFLLLEAIRRKPVSEKYEGIIHIIGFLFLLAIIILFSFGDILRLINGE